MRHEMIVPGIAVSATRPEQAPVELIAVPYFEEDDPGAFGSLDGATGGELARAAKSGELAGRAFRQLVTPLFDREWIAARAVLIGAGRRDRFDHGALRRLAAVASSAARKRRAASVGLWLRGWPQAAPGPAAVVARLAQAAAEGLMLGAFETGHLRTSDREPATLAQALIVWPDLDDSALRDAGASSATGRLLGEHTNIARRLVNEPGGHLTPESFVETARDLAEGLLGLDVIDQRQARDLGMGLLVGVGQGSRYPPRLLVVSHDPAAASRAPVVGLVGKGVTFDAGGLSLKPAAGMDRMKDDMAGGAAVLAAMRAIALLRLPLRVRGLIPLVENMPGGGAIRPGDVLTSAEGKTVEVIDTDAEGRLILADALWYARRLGCTHLVDIATLTGACSVALGRVATGLMGRPDTWVERIEAAADRAGDRVWRLPLFEDYREQLRSETADLVNVGGRPAGAVTAAIFLREFAGELPWAHLDIAGTAFAEEASPCQPKGGTGVGVRTLVELIAGLAARPL